MTWDRPVVLSGFFQQKTYDITAILLKMAKKPEPYPLKRKAGILIFHINNGI